MSLELIHVKLDPTAGRTAQTERTDLLDDTGLLRWVKGTETSGRSLLREHPTETLCYQWTHSRAYGHLDSS